MPTATEQPADDATERHLITPPTMRHMHGLFRNHGLTTDEAVHAYLSALIGREIKSRKDITEAEGRAAIDDLAAAAVIGDNPGNHPSLAVALVALQAELPKVPKNQTARIPTKDGGSYSYKYADLGDVSDAVTPLLVKHGVAFLCLPRMTPGGYELVGTLLHATGDQAEGSLPLWGRQAQDLGSSITYARRYLLGCMTGVITDEDEDGALAAQQEQRARTQQPWTGPTVQQSIDRLSELAISQGIDLETITAKRRNDWLNGLPVDQLETAPPAALAQMVTEIEAYIAQHATQPEGAPA
jgi:hypothetical protein